MANLVTAFHLRGMTDVTGTPTAEITTLTCDLWSDGSLRVTGADGRIVVLRDPDSVRALGEMLGLSTLHDG